MFDIGWSELVVIGVVALIAIGPKELPGVLRTAGHWVGKMRRMASDFQDQFREAMREAEVADLKKQFDDAQAAASSMTSGFDNPLETARREMEKAVEDKPLAAPEALLPDAPKTAETVEAAEAPQAGTGEAVETRAEEAKLEEIKPEEIKPEEIKTEEIKTGGSAA
jgi:sec-independent protein translocase protein TatB